MLGEPSAASCRACGSSQGQAFRFGLHAIARPSRSVTSAFVTMMAGSRLAQRRRRDHGDPGRAEPSRSARSRSPRGTRCGRSGLTAPMPHARSNDARRWRRANRDEASNAANAPYSGFPIATEQERPTGPRSLLRRVQRSTDEPAAWARAQANESDGAGVIAAVKGERITKRVRCQLSRCPSHPGSRRRNSELIGNGRPEGQRRGKERTSVARVAGRYMFVRSPTRGGWTS